MRGFENIEGIESVSRVSKSGEKEYSEQQYQEGLKELDKAKKKEKQQRDAELMVKMTELNGSNDAIEHDKDRVQEFIRDNCVEPIPGINKIIPFKDLVDILVKGAEDEGKVDVKKSILDGNAKDERIYELKAYKRLLDKGFILPSDNRSYKDEQYHLGVDYTVKAGVEVRSIYDGKVVASGLDGGLGHRVIIEHSMPDGTKFCSLYAHLGSGMLPEVGKNIKPGDIIGKVGQAFTEENGNWEEHLHFQIMEDKDSPKGYSKIQGEGNYDVLKCLVRNNG